MVTQKHDTTSNGSPPQVWFISVYKQLDFKTHRIGYIYNVCQRKQQFAVKTGR